MVFTTQSSQTMATNKNLSCPVGKAASFSGPPLSLTNIAGWNLAFTIFDAFGNVLVQIATGSGIIITDAVNGIITINLTAAQTQQVPRTYRYDLWRTDVGFEDRLAAGSFVFLTSSR